MASVTSAFSGTLLGPVGKLLSLGTDARKGGKSKWVVACSAGIGGTGATKYVQSIFITLSAAGLSYTTGAPQVGNEASPVSANAWFDSGFGIVAIGLVLAVAGIFLHLRKTGRLGKVVDPA